MRKILALIVVLGLSVGIADASDYPPTVAPKNDVRLFNLTREEPKRIGILTYYPNVGGGYTFLEHEDIVFYSLPYMPTTYTVECVTTVRHTTTVLGTIGTNMMPRGGQTLYRSEMKEIVPGVHRREDTPIAKWTRNTPTGRFRLLVMDVDSQTRVKLKSIVSVLDRAEHAP
jgi:hypothetical protein